MTHTPLRNWTTSIWFESLWNRKIKRRNYQSAQQEKGLNIERSVSTYVFVKAGGIVLPTWLPGRSLFLLPKLKKQSATNGKILNIIVCLQCKSSDELKEVAGEQQISEGWISEVGHLSGDGGDQTWANHSSHRFHWLVIRKTSCFATKQPKRISSVPLSTWYFPSSFLRSAEITLFLWWETKINK